MTTPSVLERKTMGTKALAIFAMAASATLVVFSGAIPVAFASTGVIALPLLFVLVGLVIAVNSVGYTAMAQRVKHPAVYYAAIAQGLGRPVGVAGGLVTLLAYNAILIAQFGLFGVTANTLFGLGPWWVWALVAAVIVGVFGRFSIVAATVFLAIVLGIGVLILLMFDWSSLAHPATGTLSSAGWSTAGLTGAVGGGIAYVIASLMGFELPAAFVEERLTEQAPRRAVYAALGILIVIYAITSYAMISSTGASDIAKADPIGFLGDRYSPVMPPLVNFFVLLAIITSMLAFQSTINRYTMAIARERVLPAWLSSTGQGVSPVNASLTQSTISVLVIIGFALTGADPIATLFSWFSALGALGLLSALTAISLAALVFLNRKPAEPAGIGTRIIAPAVGLLGGIVLLIEMLANIDSLAGTGAAAWVVPVVVVVVAAAGVLWAAYVKDKQPQTYAGIGRGTTDFSGVVDARLSDIPL